MNCSIPYILNDTIINAFKQWYRLLVTDTMMIKVELQGDKPVSSTYDVVSIIDEIYEYGIGYNDVLTSIVFPLIIALFAFSFPFMFERINQINNKYNSAVLSELFRKSWAYKFFWIMNVVAMLYVLIAGGLTIWKPQCIYIDHEGKFVWCSLLVAMTYAISAFWLAKLSVEFNKPIKLLEIIKSRYRFDVWQVKWVSFKLWVRYHYRRYRYPQDKVGHKRFKLLVNVNLSTVNRYPNDLLVDRHIAVACYAIKENDPSLYISVQNAMDFVFNRERQAVAKWEHETEETSGILESDVHYESMRFFEKVCEVYTPFKHYVFSDSTVIWKMLGVFNKGMYMSYGDIFRLATCMRTMIDGSKLSLLESYIEKSRYYFTYINRLPQLLYIKGDNNNLQPKVEIESQKNWDELCNFHFLMAAYAFRCEQYTLLSSFLDNESHWDDQLYPLTRINILLRYANCKLNFISYSNDELFGRKVDIDELLNQYTCALFLMADSGDNSKFAISAEPELINILKDSKGKLSKYEHLIKMDSRLNRLYPRLQDVTFILEYDRILKEIETCDKLYYEVERKPNSLQHLIQWICCTEIKHKEMVEMDVYGIPFNQKNIESFKERWRNAGKDICKPLSNILNASTDVEYDNSYDVGACQLLVNRLNFIRQEESTDLFGVYGKIVELISTRIAYIILCAFSEMEIKEVDVSSPDFDRFFSDYVGKDKNDYILVDIESPFNSLLGIKYKNNERYYKDVTFVSMDSSSRIGSMNVLPAFERFKESLLIVSKSILPFFEYDVDNVDFDYTDESCKEKMKLAVRTTVDIHGKVKYNKGGTIMKVNCKKLSF